MPHQKSICLASGLILALAAISVCNPAWADARLPECSPVIELTKPCALSFQTYYGTDADLNPQAPSINYVPLPIRVNPSPKMQVIVYVAKRPMEKVSAKIAYTQQTKPDVMGTALAQLAKPLGGLTISSITTPSTTSVDEITNTKADEVEFKLNDVFALDRAKPPTETPAVTHLRELESQRKAVRDAQKNAAHNIKQQSEVLKSILSEISQAQRFVPKLDGNWIWNADNKKTFQACINHIMARLAGGAAPAQDNSCVQAPAKIPALPAPPNNTAIGALSDLRLEVAQAKVELQSGNFENRLHTIQSEWAQEIAKKGQVSEAQRNAFDRLFSAEAIQTELVAIQRLSDHQTTIEDLLKSTDSAEEPLAGYKDTLTKFQSKLYSGAPDQDFVVTPIQITTYDRPPQPVFKGQMAAQITLTTQTLINLGGSDNTGADQGAQAKPATAANASATATASSGDTLGSASITWVDQRFEISGGLMWSNVKTHTFQNSPIIANGSPMLDGSGKLVTEVTETTGSPTIDAVVLFHYRFLEIPVGTRRIAVFGSAGVGTGTNGSTTDGLFGPSIAYGNFFISPVLHFTRDTRLTNGVTLGDKLGAQPPNPPTEKYWVHKLGIAFTYAIPIT